MESERNEEAGTTEIKEEVMVEHNIIEDMLIGGVKFSMTELMQAHNKYTLINTRVEQLAHKLRMAVS